MRSPWSMAVCLCACLMWSGAAAEGRKPPADAISRHMVAQAMLTAHFIDAALKAGMGRAEINAVLAKVAAGSAVSEFWVSDERGRVVFTNLPGTDFAFPTDPASGGQAAPFAALLRGDKSVVVQGVRKRALDGAPFRYVGVAGVDSPRIVQVGVSAAGTRRR